MNNQQVSKISRFFRSEGFLVACLSLVILSLSFASLLYHLTITPPNTIFPLIHNYGVDYFYYLHLMKQAAEGHWQLISRYTPENFSAQFVYVVFMLLGKVASLTHLDLPFTYTLARLVFGSMFILLIYKLIRLAYPHHAHTRILAVYLTLFGSGFWIVQTTPKGLTINRFLDYWTEIDTLDRLTFLPHHLLAKALMVLVLIVLVQSAFARPRLARRILQASGLSLICGLSSPYVLINLIIILAIVGITIVMLNLFQHLPYFQGRLQSRFRKASTELSRMSKFGMTFFGVSTILIITIIIIISSLSLLYLRFIEQSGFPWNHYVEWERLTYPVSVRDYILMLGPGVIFAAFGIRTIFTVSPLLAILLISWLIEPIIGIVFLSSLIPMQNVRYLSQASFIPAGILAAGGLITLTRFIGQKLHVSSGKILKISLFLLSVIFIINIWSNLEKQLASFSPRYFNYYIPRDLLAGFAYLDSTTPANSIVLSEEHTSNMLPAFAHNKTIVGHFLNTYHIEEKSHEVKMFFRQNDPVFAASLLKKYQIHYVFFSLDTGPAKADFIRQLGLQLIFQNPSVAIYEVIRA